MVPAEVPGGAASPYRIAHRFPHVALPTDSRTLAANVPKMSR
jgi:hypothetical protein